MLRKCQIQPLTTSKIIRNEELSGRQNLQRNPRKKQVSVTPKIKVITENKPVEPAIINIRGYVYTNLSEGVYVRVDMVKEKMGKVRTPKDILPLLAMESIAEQEHVIVFTMDGNNQVIKKHLITKGLVNQSQIHPREVFRPAIQDNAVSIFVAHNHPSGNLEPSESDLVATRRLVEVSKTMGIPVLDHVIVSSTGFLSLREKFPTYFY